MCRSNVNCYNRPIFSYAIKIIVRSYDEKDIKMKECYI